MESFTFPDKIDEIALKLWEESSNEKKIFQKNILSEAHFYMK